MNRGEIWEADIGGRIGKRPFVILTRSSAIPHINKVVVAEVTTKGKGYPTEIDIGQSANLRHHSFVAADNLYCIPKEKLNRYYGLLSDDLMKEISRAVMFALDLEESISFH